MNNLPQNTQANSARTSVLADIYAAADSYSNFKTKHNESATTFGRIVKLVPVTSFLGDTLVKKVGPEIGGRLPWRFVAAIIGLPFALLEGTGRGLREIHRSSAAGKFREKVVHGIRTPVRSLRTPRSMPKAAIDIMNGLAPEKKAKTFELTNELNESVEDYKEAKSKYQERNKRGFRKKASRQEMKDLKKDYLKAKNRMLNAKKAVRTHYKEILNDYQPKIDKMKQEKSAAYNEAHNSALRAKPLTRLARILPVIYKYNKKEPDALKMLVTQQLQQDLQSDWDLPFIGFDPRFKSGSQYSLDSGVSSGSQSSSGSSGWPDGEFDSGDDD